MEFSVAAVGHRHCDTCVKVGKCTKRSVSGESCNIIYCTLMCGSRFHGCKEAEHLELCPNVKVPCINLGYGCPAILMRRDRAMHLMSCPASCVPCTAEWNRWPLCSKERQAHVPFMQTNPHLQEHHLDVALALRDQGMVNHWMVLPRKVKKLMRCNTTPRHPAIPLPSVLWNSARTLRGRSASSDDGRPVNYESTPRTNLDQSDTSILSVTSTDDESPWGRRLKPPGLLQSVCSQLFSSKTERMGIIPQQSQHLIANQNFAPEDNLDDTLSDVSNEDFDENKCDSTGYAPDNSEPDAIQPPSLPCLMTLGLDLSIECIPRYQNKPKSMYTFVCGKDFRRDEYAWHYRNWHSDIHGGLDGWIEQRCPLARYGCSYARRRIHPMKEGYRVIYSPYVNSFGITCTNLDQSAQSSKSSFLFTDLPFELLRNIATYLDPFSLGHLSLTCSLLRDVAFSLLRSKGLVAAQWQKTKQGWRITHYRWSFSSAFSSVHRWGFEDGGHMNNHLANCRYNIRSNFPLPSRIALPFPGAT